MENQAYQKPLNMEEAADFLDISKSHLYKLTSRGEIRHYKPTGKRIYFFPKDLIEYLKNGRVKTAEEIEAEAIKTVTA
ncbi:MAG: helix-turn-helix domain-containing protein [Balneolaceae bacterium]|nr:helix-turn-helix domain-containing protein [Balneolaceae bacterium]